MAVEKLLGTRAQRAFISTIAVQAIAVLALVALTFHDIDDAVDVDDTHFKTTACYLALFAFAEVFELVMAYDALRARNTIQLLALLAFHAALIVFASLQAYETEYSVVNYGAQCGTLACSALWSKVEGLVIAIPCVIFAAWLVMIACARSLYFEFGWAIFHVVGASPSMKVMYQWYQVMICLLKFDFFCFVGVTMQLLIVVLGRNHVEFGLTVAAIPVVLILLVFAGIAVRREIKWLMSISLVLMLASETYFIYKLVRFFTFPSDEEYTSTRTTLTFFTLLAFLILFATFAVGLRCFADFDKGLLNAKTARLLDAAGGKPATPAYLGSASDRQSYFAGGAPLQHRMSIE